MEILGNNLYKFFSRVDPTGKYADITYASTNYEVWKVSEELFKNMCDMPEENFIRLAGEDAWWRQCDGSVFGVPDTKFKVNGKYIIGWDTPICASKIGYKYENLTDYLCNCLGVSSAKNICTCCVNLAKYNNMTMVELFEKYGE